MKKTFLIFILLTTASALSYYLLDKKPGHPIGYSNTDEEVHLHSDFEVFLDGRLYDFSNNKYQSKAKHIQSEHIHLHDNVGHIIHRHEHNITLQTFFASLGFDLTDECITTDENATFCSDENNQLQLFVNGQLTNPIANYVNEEEDQILLFYGPPDDDVIDNLLSNVTDEACIYSGTCPERGVAPAESCGLTCEL